jgi:hypothetical protein
VTFGAVPPPGLTKDIMSRMIAYRIQEEAFGGLDRELVKLLDRLARGEKPNELSRRLKPGTVLVREYKGKRLEEDFRTAVRKPSRPHTPSGERRFVRQ